MERVNLPSQRKWYHEPWHRGLRLVERGESWCWLENVQMAGRNGGVLIVFLQISHGPPSVTESTLHCYRCLKQTTSCSVSDELADDLFVERDPCTQSTTCAVFMDAQQTVHKVFTLLSLFWDTSSDCWFWILQALLKLCLKNAYKLHYPCILSIFVTTAPLFDSSL